MNDPAWILLPPFAIESGRVVWREWPDGTQESRFVSSFEVSDPDYSTVMALLNSAGA